MKVTVSVAPPGGGPQDHSFDLDMTVLPDAADCLKVVAGAGTSDYLVRRRSFLLNKLGTENPKYSEKKVVLEVEPVLTATSSPEHRQACERYAQQGKQVSTLTASA